MSNGSQADTTTDREDRASATWAPRVSPAAIRRLYQTDALGIVDEEQIAAVGEALAARCRSILQVTDAHQGRATCPHCIAAQAFQVALCGLVQDVARRVGVGQPPAPARGFAEREPRW